jgi:hypothetical protein
MPILMIVSTRVKPLLPEDRGAKECDGENRVHSFSSLRDSMTSGGVHSRSTGVLCRMLLEAGNVIFGEIHFQRIGEGPAA